MTQWKKLVTLVAFYARQAWEYKANVFSEILSAVIVVGLLLYFWSLVGETSVLSSNRDRLIYFLLADAVQRLTTGRNFSHIGKLARQVKTGEVTSSLLLPIDLWRHVIAIAWGREATAKVLAVATIIVALAIAGISVGALFSLALMLAIMITIGYFFTKLVSSIVFITTEADGLRMALAFAARLLSGGFVPLALMPDFWRYALEWSPFSYLGYWLPAVASGIEVDYPRVILVGAGWIAVLAWLSRKAFNAALERAEVVGL